MTSGKTAGYSCHFALKLYMPASLPKSAQTSLGR
jgi:hypothetical protein